MTRKQFFATFLGVGILSTTTKAENAEVLFQKSLNVIMTQRQLLRKVLESDSNKLVLRF